jgi:hypothetical protein
VFPKIKGFVVAAPHSLTPFIGRAQAKPSSEIFEELIFDSKADLMFE